MATFAEYIWVDGTEPTPRLRSKTKVLDYPSSMERASGDGDLKLPEWGFDGSSTGQASGDSSDCILKPVCSVPDPTRRDGVLALCEVFNADGSPGKNNHRAHLRRVTTEFDKYEPWFGIEQEYTFFKGRSPLGWPEGGYPAPQGPFYCGVGADEVFGRKIVEEHMSACTAAGLKLSGVNAEVMPGQWEFQIGAADPLTVSDHLLLARYILYRIAEKHGVTVKLDPKPVDGDWNGAGAHTNFSTKKMRSEPSGRDECTVACVRLGASFEEKGFPSVYGHGFEKRLTGAHETCSYKEFKFGVADRTASVRIPLHVDKNGKGYIEDRRPCANIDPYQVCAYLIETVCEE